ncbi:UDP-N-acetylmuramate--L-alanine ligase [Desulfoglaeba alkanexedens]|uniref:UDP-N-acetylmuramate--L-alanine ligase n=1 Tax=Desulfoglaeba alkanexedens ALDC TaxID=980445 RepID=A0A4P8L4T5_9BACT|nr:Mur ligase family protein [Desulfoglaeba alkanexedens]QCQ22854.1 hypothetical protein FDQ92_12135 [Desulfoglaeba alkanexedens ALDC]
MPDLMDRQRPLSVYFMGIGGIAMGTLATLFKELGHRVSGSDRQVYPPMSTHLQQSGIVPFEGYRVENLEAASPDLVIIGNVIRRDNPEARYVMERGLPYLSMPQAVQRFFLDRRRSLVVAGTHGKSTTAALLAWILDRAGTDPSAFVGGILNNWGASHRLGEGPFMVLEGDEYDTAFFDKGPKFIHYRPWIGIVTGVEFDHADIFRDFEHVLETFKSFCRIIPADGALVLNAEDPHHGDLRAECPGRVVTYGASENADWRLLEIRNGPRGLDFLARTPDGKARWFESPLPGRHNALNALAAAAAVSLSGLAQEAFAEGLKTFLGVKRRQEILGEAGGVVVIDDFAHHPTAVRETVRAVRGRYPGKRILAVFEPRTNSSRRRIFQANYAEAFDNTDWTAVKEPPDLEKVPEGERLDTRALVAAIRSRGVEARCFSESAPLLDALMEVCRPGDVVLCMSNGDFDGVPYRLLERLRRTAEVARNSGVR